MSRRHITFDCQGETLVGTLDDAVGDGASSKVGLLIVTGGNETRAGAYSGQAQLAARIAAAGYPCFRFDRRGVGDSTGENAGFEGSEADINAAIETFKSLKGRPFRVTGFGNCDAASALMIAGGAHCDNLLVANPWAFDAGDTDSFTPDAVRSRYTEKLKNPRELMRLVSGGVSFKKLYRGIRQAMAPAPPPSPLLEKMLDGMSRTKLAPKYLLAANDRTAQAFMAAWDYNTVAFRICEDAGHSFAEPHARDWLYDQLINALDQET